MKTKKTSLRSARLLGRVRNLVKELAAQTIGISDRICALAEPPLKEFKSCRLLADFLARQGFKVTWPWKPIPTGFLAVKGKGRPVLQVLAEYDALPDCGPKTGLWGHGCGHNLLGAAAVLAGIVAARVMEERGLAGQIQVVGTPAEETVGGKVWIAQRGGFDKADAIMVWHPTTETFVDNAGLQAMDSILFEFGGRTAHAAGSPDKGRSALDACMLMDVAVNYLREHVPDDTRMHCIIVDGGKAPNVVPDKSVVWYYIRGRGRSQVDDLRRRVVKCAQAAALATETTMKMDILTCCAERLPNNTLAGMMQQLLTGLGMPKYTPADVRQARKLSPGRKIVYQKKIGPIRNTQRFGSSDEDNASWFAPMGKIWATTVPKDTISHNRDCANLGVSSAAHKGMLKAAEVLGAAMIELAVNKPLLRKAQAEFAKIRKGKQYKLPVSKRAIELSYALAGKTAPPA